MRFFHRLLLIGVLNVVGHPRRTLLVGGIVLAGSALLAMSRLRIETDQDKLLDPNVSFFQDYLKFTQRFPENEAIYLIIESANTDRIPPVPRWTGLADALTRRLRGMPQYVESVDCKVPVEKLGTQGLLFDSAQSVKQNFEDTRRFLPLARLWGEQPGPLTRLLGSSPSERFITALRTQAPDAQTAGFVRVLALSWNQALNHPDQPLQVGTTLPDLAALDADDPSRLGYYYVPDESDPSRHLMLVRVFDRTRYNSLTAISETVEAIRAAVGDTARTFPEFKVGVTGRPALEADEMRTSDRDSNRAEVIALAAVFIGLVLMLRSFWLALAGEIALGVGIGWTFGWATLAVGELNLLSIVFLLALIGIGMDYLVQVLTRYRQEVARRGHPTTIWVGVFRHVAPPINTACMGAAGAFFVSIFTHFRGAAQLGIIAGGGLLLCLLSGYVILPALLTLFPLKIQRGDELPDLGRPAYGGKRNLVLPALWIALLLAGIPLARQTQFDPGLLSMQAPKLESVQLVRKLQTWSAVVLSRDLQTLRRARDSVQASPLVKSTESILGAYDNLAWLRQHENELPQIKWSQPQPVAPADLPSLGKKARGLAEHFASTEAVAPLAEFADLLPGASADRLSEWQRAFVAYLRDLLLPFGPSELDIDKLPPELRNHLVGTDGSFALYLYPRRDLWNQSDLSDFATDIESRLSNLGGDALVTGIAINVFHSTGSIRHAFHKATIYALLLILLLVFIDLRKPGQTLLAVSVLALGLPMLAAVMGLLGVDWNFANFFGLPILIGAGHEYGVFLVHRYREALHDPRRVWRRWDVSDRALLLCAYVTCTSFGFFWALAHHRGLRSLGLVMALGTACIYLSAVLVLRPLLLWRLAAKRRAAR